MPNNDTESCDLCGADLLLLPIIWRLFRHRWAQASVYFALMVYIFVGIAIIADTFMKSIERITSATRKVYVQRETGPELIQVSVWNKTVANLTLMALGNAAPEILLTTIETVGDGFELGELGSGAIVGAAAFNLFVVTGICMVSVGKNQRKRIFAQKAFAVTAAFNVFAYVWLYFVLAIITPNYVDIAEAILTLLFFPLMVFVGYAADRDFFRNKRNNFKSSSSLDSSLPDIYSTGERMTNLSQLANNDGDNESEIKESSESVAEPDNWCAQIQAAFHFDAIADSPKPRTYFVHSVTFAWKIIIALLPPVSAAGGWPTFFSSLVVIGVLTTLMGDFATAFGAVIGLKDHATAITFVALGTSLPDLFSSIRAAKDERYADSAIGNVTGSNAFNVYLGLGLPWLIAAGYHTANGTRLSVPAGGLGFSVGLFTVLSLLSIGVLVLRRYSATLGNAELGGPREWAIACFLVFMAFWIVYVSLSIWQIYK